MNDFKAYPEIPQLRRRWMTIIQKIHGSNSQIYITEESNGFIVKAGSRTRWLTPDDDNFGFAKFVEERKDALIEFLGVGRHFGEWAGPGINSGEGLKEKTLVLFNHRKFADINLPENIATVPVLYSGIYDEDKIIETFERLRQEGSFLAPGFMRPEGIVIDIDGKLYKKVFEDEEAKWKKSDKVKTPNVSIDVSYLLQPIRLEKLLSRDERYIREYPKTLPEICSLYVKDLEKEAQLVGSDDEVQAIKKALGRRVFHFVKTIVEARS